jgi:hypothetical protein
MRSAEDVVEDVNPVRRHPEWVAAIEQTVSRGLFEAAFTDTLFGMILTIYRLDCN